MEPAQRSNRAVHDTKSRRNQAKLGTMTKSESGKRTSQENQDWYAEMGACVRCLPLLTLTAGPVHSEIRVLRRQRCGLAGG